MNKLNMIKLPCLVIVSILITTSFVLAFGVSSPYWSDHPLTMAAGETKLVDINLQNMVGTDDVAVKAEITNGGDIATLNGDIYNVKAGTSDTMVPLEIKIPRKANDGDSYPVTVEFKTVAPEEGGMITMGTGMTIGFNVLVEGKTPNYVLYVSVGFIILLIIILIIIILRKKPVRKKKK